MISSLRERLLIGPGLFLDSGLGTVSRRLEGGKCALSVLPRDGVHAFPTSARRLKLPHEDVRTAPKDDRTRPAEPTRATFEGGTGG